jgi:hypothetical protein
MQVTKISGRLSINAWFFANIKAFLIADRIKDRLDNLKHGLHANLEGKVKVCAVDYRGNEVSPADHIAYSVEYEHPISVEKAYLEMTTIKSAIEEGMKSDSGKTRINLDNAFVIKVEDFSPFNDNWVLTTMSRYPVDKRSPYTLALADSHVYVQALMTKHFTDMALAEEQTKDFADSVEILRKASVVGNINNCDIYSVEPTVRVRKVYDHLEEDKLKLFYDRVVSLHQHVLLFNEEKIFAPRLIRENAQFSVYAPIKIDNQIMVVRYPKSYNDLYNN